MPRSRNTITACQHSIVIRSAARREAAIEVAKQRFAELDGIPSWQSHVNYRGWIARLDRRRLGLVHAASGQPDEGVDR